MKKYTKHSNAAYRKTQNETMDCGVIAMAIVARMTYKEAHHATTDVGRRHKRGMRTSMLVKAIRNEGFTVEPVPKMVQKNGCKYTPKTIGKKLKNGYYLCVTTSHFFAVVNGTVEDWTNGRRHHVMYAYKVVRTRK